MKGSDSMKKRKFKSLVTLYQDYDDNYVTDENPRNYWEDAEFCFARKGTIFTLEYDNDEESEYPIRLCSNKISVLFENEEDIKETRWFEEVFKDKTLQRE